MLVQYDPLGERHTQVSRRSYYLWHNQARIAAGKKPKWAKATSTEGARPIPVIPYHDASTNSPPEQMTYAVTVREGRAFTLHRPSEPTETFDLPVYAETHGTAIRLALTPFAVVGDTVMACGVVAVFGFLVWAQSGAPR